MHPDRKRLAEVVERRNALITEQDAIEALDAPTEEDATRSESLVTEWDAIEAELNGDGTTPGLRAKVAKLDSIRSASRDEANVEDEQKQTTNRSVGNVRQIDPYDDLKSVERNTLSAGDLRSRAMKAVEIADIDDASRAHVASLIDHKDPRERVGMARHMLLTGSPQYLEDFQDYVQHPSGRTALSLTSANGGYLVPFTLDPSIILTNAGAVNPYRDLATIKTTATNNWNGVTSAGVNAAFLAEAGVATDASPTVGTLQITPAKAAAWLFGSYEILEDSDFGSQLPTLLADAKNRLEESKFSLGSGTNEPWGVVTRAGTVNSAGAAAFAIADPYAVLAALGARFRTGSARPAWLGALGIINRLRQFDTAGGSSYWTNLGLGQPERLLGAPLYESTTMVSTITTGSKNLLLGDFSQYYIVDRIGMSVLYEPMVKDQATARPTGQGGWFAFWRVGGDVTTASAFKVLVET